MSRTTCLLCGSSTPQEKTAIKAHRCVDVRDTTYQPAVRGHGHALLVEGRTDLGSPRMGPGQHEGSSYYARGKKHDHHPVTRSTIRVENLTYRT